MPTFHLHLQNVPPEAGTIDIRHFFSPLDIADGGVQIVGGPEGNVFITFSNYEQLLEATTYNKRYFMGRQMLFTLCDGNDIKKVVEKMMQELGVQSAPVEMSSIQQMSQSRELASAWGSSEFTPPQESTVPSNDPPWSNRRRAATPPQLAGCGTFYDGGEAKRMRLSNQQPYEGSYSSSWAASSGDLNPRKEKIAMELELELKIAQDIADQLERKKERIEKLKQGMIREEDIDTVTINDPTIEAEGISQITNSRAEWERRQPEPEPAPSRYLYDSEKRMQPEAFPVFPMKSMEEPRYEKEKIEIHPGPRLTEDPRHDRFGRTEARFDQPSPPARHSTQYDIYNREDTMYTGPSAYPKPSLHYEDQRYNEQNEGNNRENHGPHPYHEDQRLIMDVKNWDKNTSIAQPQKSKDPFICNRNPDVDDGHRSRRKDVARHAATGVPEIRRQAKIPDLMGLVLKTTLPHVSLDDKPGVHYLQLNSLLPDTTACEVWSWFGGATGPSSHVTVTSTQETERTAYVAFWDSNRRDAEKKKYTGTKSLREKEALSSIACAGICPNAVIFKSTNRENDDIMTKEQKLALIKEWYPQGLTKLVLASPQVKETANTAGSTAPQVRTASLPVKKQKPPPDDSKAALYFMTLRSLPKNATASGIWGRFGGPLGCSAGVLLFDKRGSQAEKMAFVAYEDYNNRNAQLAKISKAESCSDGGVYSKCANGPHGSKVFKTTPTGQDIELSVSEKALLNQPILQKKIQEKSKKEKEDQRVIVNRISRSLFYDETTEEKQQTNIQDSEGKKFGSGQTKNCYLRLEFGAQEDLTACKVWSWFGGTTGSCLHVTLTKNTGGQATGKDRAYAAFRDHESRNAARKKYNKGIVMSEEGALYRIAHVACQSNIEILKSTDTGTDEVMAKEERLALKKKWDPDNAEESPYILQIKGVSQKNSACKVWSWFGGKNGASQGVTIMEDGQTRIAFVKFNDHMKCNHEQVKYQLSKIITESEMLKMLACSEHRIRKSSPKGDCSMSMMERADLKRRVDLEMKQAGVEREVDPSEATSGGQKKVAEKDEADISIVQEEEKSDAMSEGHSASSSQEPKVKTAKKYAEKKTGSSRDCNKSEDSSEGHDASSTWELELMDDACLGDI